MSNDSPRSDSPPLYRFWQPRYWPLWLSLSMLWLAVKLPFRIQLLLGRVAGFLLRVALPKRRRIAEINLRLCFPELGEAERSRLLNEHFASLGIAVFELGMAWWASEERIRRLVNARGLEHLEIAVAEGRGVIVLSGHFPATELTGRILKLTLPGLAAMYRPSHNPLVDEVLRRGRGRSATLLIPKDDIRLLLRTLKKGLPVWYAPDQSHRRRYSALVPFFHQPAMTNTALTKICQLSGAKVVPYLPRRRADGSGYDVDILPALADFPGESPEADAGRINALLEEHIRGAPEQYYWVHRRFKGRPPPLPDPYVSGPGVTGSR